MKTLLRRFILAVFLSAASFPSFGHAGQPTRDVVLVPGFLDRGTIFDRLKIHLEARGFRCHVSSLKPSDGRGGLDLLAEGLKRDVDGALGPRKKIAIVAFSMGGLVSRHYLQELGGAKRCETLITLATPHHGTHTAWFYPSKGAMQMRPGSDFLAQLKASEHRLADMRVTSIYTPMDLMILPARHSEWECAVNQKFPVVLHTLMPCARDVMAEIERQLSE